VSGRVVRVLTRRQVEVLRLAANGNTSAEIANWLGVSADTVNGTLRHVYRALGVGDRAHAVAVALRVGLLRPGDVTVPEALRARLRPVGGVEAPWARRDAERRSGGDGGAVTGDGRADRMAPNASEPGFGSRRPANGPGVPEVQPAPFGAPVQDSPAGKRHP
jgi:DNA-binding CsgD family transcriptional regulator